MKRKTKLSEKFIALSLRCLTSFIKQKSFGSEKIRWKYLKELKSYNLKNRFIGECCLVDKCIDKDSILIGIHSNTCKTISLPIHVKCVSKMGWNHNNCYYCCHDCMIGGK